MFHPGETVTHTFTIPFIVSEVSEIVVTYKQNDHIILKKTITSGFEEAGADKTKIVIAFSQQESLLFAEKRPFTIQLNVCTVDGTRCTSKEIKSETGVQHHKEVMTNG